MGHKYAVLILPLDRNELQGTLPVTLDPSTTAFVARLGSIVAREETAHWREWLGSHSWDELLKRDRLFVLTIQESQRPEVTDQENQALALRLQSAWEALALTQMTRPPTDEAWILTGELASLSPIHLKSVRTTQKQHPLIFPWYCRQASYWESPPQPPKPWEARWAAVDRLLVRTPENELPLLLRIAVMTFVGAKARDLVEARLLDFVQAAETVLALPKENSGSQEFARRAAKFTTSILGDPFLAGWDAEQRLQELYVHRNAGVHGKIPFELLRSSGDEGKEIAARFEYLAEAVAREALLFAIQPEHRSFFSGRARIEAAWRDGTFPLGR